MQEERKGRMRSVALVGFAEPSRELVRNVSGDVEIWTLNRAWHFNFPRIDRLFELHTLEYLSDPNNQDTRGAADSGYKTHWDWLHEKHDYPIYMIETYPEIPGAVRYPLEAVSEIYQGLGRRVFTSTFDFMIALAIAEKYERIYIFGFEMATSTEYDYQRMGGHLLIGAALGRGIEVILPPDSMLVPKMKLYGYEGAQMISRQTLEGYYRNHQEQKTNWLAIANAKFAILQHMQKNGSTPEELSKAQGEWLDASSMMDKYDGSCQLLKHLIDECDMLEVNPELDQSILVVDAAASAYGENKNG